MSHRIDSAQPSYLDLRAVLVASLVVALVLLGTGWFIGRESGGPEWRQGRAHVGVRMATVSVDDWEYGIRRGVAWVDRRGSRHESGWPACLDVRPGTNVRRVRFSAIEVEVDGTEWREVLVVDCRGRR